MFAPEIMAFQATPRPPVAIPKAYGSRWEYKLLFLSFSSSALAESIGVGFPKIRPKSTIPARDLPVAEEGWSSPSSSPFE